MPCRNFTVDICDFFPPFRRVFTAHHCLPTTHQQHLSYRCNRGEIVYTVWYCSLLGNSRLHIRTRGVSWLIPHVPVFSPALAGLFLEQRARPPGHPDHSSDDEAAN